MTKSIFITGISGSGKSTLTKELIRRGHVAYDIENIDGMFTMVDKETGKKLQKWDNANLELVKRYEWICDKEKLQDLIRKHKNGVVYCLGAGSNAEELLPLFDLVIVLRASPEVLRRRLTHRTENDFAKTAEVQDWLLQYQDEWDKDWEKRGAVFVNSNGSVEDTASAVIEASKF